MPIYINKYKKLRLTILSANQKLRYCKPNCLKC